MQQACAALLIPSSARAAASPPAPLISASLYACHIAASGLSPLDRLEPRQHLCPRARRRIWRRGALDRALQTARGSGEARGLLPRGLLGKGQPFGVYSTKRLLLLLLLHGCYMLLLLCAPINVVVEEKRVPREVLSCAMQGDLRGCVHAIVRVTGVM